MIVEGGPERAAGTILHLGGRVLDRGRPSGARQPGSRSGSATRSASITTRATGAGRPTPISRASAPPPRTIEGAWRFRTIEPVPYPGRTPHIHFKIAGPGFEPLTTQMYLAGHPLNERDGLYRRLGEQARLVTVGLEPAPDLEPTAKSGAKRGLFDIVLGPGGIPRDG